MKCKIIYEDDQVLVCYKPAGLASQTARVGQPDMVSELKNYLTQSGKAAGSKETAGESRSGKAPYLGVIHRLDQPVEGLLVFAKNSKAAAILTAQLSKGTLNKQYYAVVCGQVTSKSGELVDYMDKDNAAGAAIVVTGREKDFPQAKKAVLQYQLLKAESDLSTSGNIALMDIHIDTGRFHQIRAQMSHAGMPLLGDNKYGSEESRNASNKLSVRNVALCAYKVVFLHPKDRRKMEFQMEPEGKIFRGFMRD